jgi:hypothetical protein
VIVTVLTALSLYAARNACAQHVTASAEPCTGDNPALFERVEIPEILVPVIVKLLERSQTFRAQCRRIVAAPHLRLAIRLIGAVQPFPVRATVRRSPGGELDARIDLTRVPSQYAEWLGHELEHVIEHLDGVDIRGRARRDDEARELRPGLFETRRATQMGWRVADEFRARRPPVVGTRAAR